LSKWFQPLNAIAQVRDELSLSACFFKGLLRFRHFNLLKAICNQNGNFLFFEFCVFSSPRVLTKLIFGVSTETALR